MAESIASISVGVPPLKIFFDLPASIAAALQSAACGAFEISGALYGVPCNEEMEIQPNLDRPGPLIVDPDYPHIKIVAIVFPPQVGSPASSEFDVVEADKLAESMLTKAYQFMKGRCGKFNMGWIHTHPRNYGVMPSAKDESSFKEMSDGKPIYIMIIIDDNLATRQVDISTNVFVRMKLSGNVYGPVGFSQNENKQVVWSGSIGVIKHPYINHLTFTKHKTANGIELIGLDPQSWRIIEPHAYNVVMKKTLDESFNIWGYNAESAIHVPSIKSIKALVESFNYVGKTSKKDYTGNNSYLSAEKRESTNMGFKW